MNILLSNKAQEKTENAFKNPFFPNYISWEAMLPKEQNINII